MVNRVWMHHFGRGLVGTPSDFGRRGEAPSHPELLDWLAARFMSEGWSIKRLHRTILLSSAYQRTSAPAGNSRALKEAREKDPENRLLWRMNPRKLSFEQMRDTWLAVTGELNREVGGKPQELLAASNVRRSLYGFIDREALPSALRQFDFANPDLSTPQRTDTVVPQQALFGLNHPLLISRARALVRRTGSFPFENDAERISRIYSLLFQRAPTPLEESAALDLLQTAKTASANPTGKTSSATPGTWEELVQMLMISNEAVFVD
jgi:hypothetical protein